MTRGVRMRRLALGVLFLGACILCFWLYQPVWVFGLLGKVFPRIVWQVSTSAPLVALTFDDGPAPDHTPEVLAILARHKAHATFFLIGDRASAHPDLVEELRRDGHEVGNHYYTIRSTWRAPDEVFRANLLKAERVLNLEGPKLFRPPGGMIRARQLSIAQAEGYTCVLGSAYPYDPSHPPSSYIRWLVAKNLRAGAIVILHDGIADPSRSIAALDGILVAGERKGLRFVTVGALLRSKASS